MVFKSNAYRTFLVLTILSCCLLLFPYLNYQRFVPQGDIGWMMYAYTQTMEGQTPFRDYIWVYGPLMNYYYALCLKAFGVSIASVVLGKLILYVVSGVFCFLAVSCFFSPVSAYLCSLWFVTFHPDFHFTQTYNHAGGITLFVLLMVFIFRYIQSLNLKELVRAAGVVVGISLVKFNFGMTALVGYAISCLVIDTVLNQGRHKGRIAYYAVVALGMMTLIYTIFFWGMKISDIRQCFIYVQGDQFHHGNFLLHMGLFAQGVWLNINKNWFSRLAAGIVFAAIIVLLKKTFFEQRLSKELSVWDKKFWLAMGVLGLFCGLNLHEYILSGFLYRKYWSAPFQILLIGFIVSYAVKLFLSKVRWLIIGFVFWVVLLVFFRAFHGINSIKDSAHFLSWPSAQVYSRMPLEWKSTVTQTMEFMNQHLRKDETFYALPYEPLYFYLLGKRSPHRLILFFDFYRISDEQQAEIIKALEEKRIRYVLISNRMQSFEVGFGTFGKTYAHVLARYLEAHFKEVARFGDWSKSPGWFENHATKILKREGIVEEK